MDVLSGGSGKVLVVDDEPFIRKLAKTILKKAGFEVITAKDGKEGLEVYTEQKDEIDIVVSDIRMPKMTGLEMYKEILKVNDKVRLVLCSGYPEDVPMVKDNFFIQKPFSIDTYLNSVKVIKDISEAEIIAINDIFK
jgi:DNA-binding NtrC family response regulator